MSLIILTKPPVIDVLSKDFIKSLLKVLLRRVRGPRAVTSSLLRGLKELKIEYFLNDYDNFKKNDILFVNESIAALKYAINLKREGKIGKLVVGPNFVLHPNDNDMIMREPEIDIILFPCEWIKQYWVSIAPELGKKIVIWPAGVRDRGGIIKKTRNLLLIYYKNCPYDLFIRIINKMKENNIKFEIIKYDSFKQHRYFNLLEKSKALIYLSNSETQGIAMFEAWERDVPTLIWNRGFAEFDGHKFLGASSSPYLSAEVGEFFTNKEEFAEKIIKFLDQLDQKNPRKYILNNFTDELCANKFLNIIGYYE